MFAEAPLKTENDQDFGYGFASNGTLCRLPIPPSKCKVFLPNCDPETLKRALRRIAELLSLSDHDDPPPAFRSLHIHLTVDTHFKHFMNFYLLEQLFSQLAPYMVELTLSSYEPTTEATTYSTELLSVLVDRFLVRSPKLTTVRLCDCVLDQFAGLKLGDLLRGHTTNDWCPLELDIQRCNFYKPPHRFFQELRRAMAACPPERRRLASFYGLDFKGPWGIFEGRPVESRCMSELVGFCAECPRLESLIVNAFNGSWYIRPHEGELFTAMPQLKILDLSFTRYFHKLSDTDVADFFDAVARHGGLETLRLCDVYLFSAHLQPLTTCLEACRKLQRLHLSGNTDLLPNDDQADSNPLVQDFLAVVSRLPVLQELTPPPFSNFRILDLLFHGLIQNKSPLRVLHIREFNRPFPVEDSWVRWIPHLRLTYLHDKVSADDPGWPQLSRALCQNTYLTGSYYDEAAPPEVSRMTDFSMKYQCVRWRENVQAVSQRNAMLNHIRRQSDELRLSSPSHWSILLQGLVNHKVLPSEKYPTPLLEFLRYNVDKFVADCCSGGNTNTTTTRTTTTTTKTS